MGLIGMAFGLGFIFGPFIGGKSLQLGAARARVGLPPSSVRLNFVLALFVLTESRQPGAAAVSSRPHLAQWMHTLRQPKVGLLVITFFLATFCFSCFESTLPLLVGDNFHLDFRQDERTASTIAYLFVYCGLIGAIVQGGAIGRLVKLLGESRLIAWSLVITALSMALLPFIKGTDPFSWGGLVHAGGRPGSSCWWRSGCFPSAPASPARRFSE